MVKGGAADRAGLADGDIVVLVNGVNVESSSHDEVVRMITNSGTTLEMLVARREVYERLKADGRQFSTQMSVESVYAQVMPRSMREERQEQDSRPDTPSEGRERVSGAAWLTKIFRGPGLKYLSYWIDIKDNFHRLIHCNYK